MVSVGLSWTLCLLALSMVSANSVFTPMEYANRLRAVQQIMKAEGVAGIMLTRPTNHMYYTGIATEFFASPTRSYFLVIPAEGKIIAVISAIATNLYELSPTVGRIVTWSGLDPKDNGVSLLTKELLGQAGEGNCSKFGAELGWEFDLRMPVSDYLRVQQNLQDACHSVVDVTTQLKQLFVMKSDEEIALHSHVCAVQSSVLNRIDEFVTAGQSEKQWCRRLRAELLLAGADRVDYMSCRSGIGGYTDIVAAASDRVLRDGDVLYADVGTVVDGYFCDFNRNFYVGAGEMPKKLVDAQQALYRAVEAGIREAREGATTASLFAAMNAELGVASCDSDCPSEDGSVGRFGHSVGMIITEWPSILPESHNMSVRLLPGMVLALEPSTNLNWNGRFLVHEEIVVVQPGGGPAKVLSVRAPRIMPRIGIEKIQVVNASVDHSCQPPLIVKGQL